MNKNELSSFQETVHKHYSPALVIFDANYYVQYITKKAKLYVTVPEDFTKAYNLLSFASRELLAILRTTMVSMKVNKESYVYDNLIIESDNGKQVVDIIIEPLPSRDIFYDKIKETNQPESNYYVLIFKEKDTPKNADALVDIVGKINFTLQEELDTTELSLYKTIAKLEHSNQNLLATNEELQSTNEEYISVNEELQSINTEYERTIKELSQANRDIDHLLQSTAIGTVFLDADLCIRKFTNTAQKLINVELQDIGRPLKFFTNNLKYDHLFEDTQRVLVGRKKVQKEIQSHNDIWYQVHIAPYQIESTNTSENGIVISFINIHKLKKTEEALQANALLYQTIFECANDGIVLFDRVKKRAKAVNKKQLEMFRMTEEEYLNTPFLNLLAPQQANGLSREIHLDNMINKHQKGVMTSRHHWIQKRMDDSLIETEVTTVLMPKPFQKYSLNIIRDVTAKNLAAKKLKKNEKYYRTLFENSMNGILIYEPKINRVVSANEKACKIFQCTQLDLLTHPPYVFMPEKQEDGEPTDRFFEKKINTIQLKGEVRHNMLLKSKKGHIIDTEIEAYRLFEKENSPVVVIIHDVTEKNKAAKVLEDTEIRYKAIFNKSFSFLAITEPNGYFIACNDTVKQLMRHQGERGQRRYLWDYECFAFDKKTQLKIKKDLLDASQHNKYANGVVNYKNNKHQVGIMNYSIKPILDKKQKLLYILTESRDITKLINTQKQLNHKLHELEDKNQELKKYIDSNLELEKFAYVTSHDLREPLRTIGGFAQLLLLKYGKSINEEAGEFINYIIRASQAMNELIEDLLTYSKVDNESYNLEDVDLQVILKQTLTKLYDLISRNQAKIHLNIDNISPNIKGNKVKLLQLFQNLIVNSIKFRQKHLTPIITITAKDLPTHWQFAVADNGIGIEKEFYNKVFLIFQHLHPKEIYGGSGIGLAICKKVVEQHNGKIWMESQLQKGTTIYFTLSKT